MAQFVPESQPSADMPWKVELPLTESQHSRQDGAATLQALTSDGEYRAPTHAYLWDHAVRPAPGLPAPVFMEWGGKAESSDGSDTCSTGEPEEAEALSSQMEKRPSNGSSTDSWGLSPVGAEPDRTPPGATRAEQTLAALANEGFSTLMIRNLPYNLSQGDLVNEIERSGFGDLHDFVYMPRTFVSGRGKGYAFVNLITSEAAILFRNSWHRSQRFATGRNKKTLDISVACVQGREANLQEWEASKRKRVINPNFRPVVRTDHEQLPSPPGLAPQAQQVPMPEIAEQPIYWL